MDNENFDNDRDNSRYVTDSQRSTENAYGNAGSSQEFSGAPENTAEGNGTNNTSANNRQNSAARESAGTSENNAAGENSTGASGKENISYTGEYGKNVNNGFRSSEYRFKPDSSTASGDYHNSGSASGADRYSGGYGGGQNYGNGNDGRNGNPYNGQNYGGYSGQNPGNNGYGGPGGRNSQSEDFGSGGRNYGNGSYGGGQNVNYGGNNGNFGNGNPYNSGTPGFNGGQPVKKRREKKNKEKGEKKPASFGKKAALTALLGVILGAAAGLCFQGVNYIFEKNGRSSTTSGNYTIGSTNDGGSADTASSSSTGTAVTKIVENTMPSIVTIACTSESQGYYDIFGGYTQGQDEVSAGTGFIIGKDDDELLIATNNHVVEGAKTISVKFADDQVYEADTKGSDSSNDLAVIAVKLSKVKKSTLGKIKIASLGDSDDLKVGEQCIAIGNALGYGQSVTVGYISAKDRQITETDENSGAVTAQINVLQTDAAINPGNSGGPLLNMNGLVIGITSAKIANSSVEGVGYAIPISYASPVFEDLIKNGNLDDSEKGYLGITGQTVDDQMQSYGMPEGVYVAEVAKNGAAEKGGILKGDIITGVDGEKITSMERLQSKVNSSRKGTTVTVTLKRLTEGKYKEKEVKVKLKGAESLNTLPSGSGKSGSSSGNGNSGSNGNNRNGNSGSDDNGSGDSGSDDDDFGSEFFNFFN